ncbi:prepilin-type N-terminal cleavage/methylation domain-containing protein [Streptococcus sanguinis]|uniref:prepilin-type N-terminal cleavage/methylation domain-containing protein n=1 Tax=Streptococcus sanguinis TaxID=1305 RepID=UPI0022E6459E|nr:prepilin-type N-terminal cleavage/methylation domain-containing protein [Streptococcus sanguinis]
MLNKLQKFRQDLKKKGKGFTLVELIVVIIIIAVLAAVAIPAITGFQDSARKSRIETEHRQLVSAIQSDLGSQVDPENPAEAPTLEKLRPYIAKNSQGKGTLADTLATDGKDKHAAHVITGNKLISTYTPASGGTAKTWTYDWKENSAPTATP